MMPIFFILISQHIYTLTLKRQPTGIFFCHHVSLQLAKACTISMLKHHELWMRQTENGKTYLWYCISANLKCHRVLYRPGQPKKENKMRLTSQHDSIFQYDEVLMHPNPNVKPPRTSRHTHMHAHTVQHKEAEKLTWPHHVQFLSNMFEGLITLKKLQSHLHNGRIWTELYQTSPKLLGTGELWG